ncbi:1-acyl-sn-glycerol-3-phosphate acyltransferase [Maribellus sediminis]|uniref:1-acyl-sn-glycerol-3-phosphate acyltransferase n=1 Tax=Maribellus sediminis TaxID=2696285 RepID=UPI00143229FB|nr:1-acyl-sn-glycerol-3-phosphate acyltransferase [Maribellus sediminis]
MKYEKWSPGYWVLKNIVRFADFIIYKQIIINSKEKIPRDKPILFAPNHQNALSDPMAVLLHTPYQPVWLARADIFKNKIAAAILRFMKIMPVYRIRDGKDQMANNDTTFNNSIKVLKSNGALALFPEAAHSGKRQMLAHKKAVPRIVFMAEEKSDENIDIHIIPTGIYYSSYWKFNRTVIVNFGDPVLVNDYLEEYKNNPNAATMALREKLYEEIDKLTINIRSKAHYQDFELIREYYGKEFLNKQGITYSPTNLFKSDQKLTNQLDQLEEVSPDKIEDVVNTVRAYQKILKKHHLRNWLVNKPANNTLKIVLNKLALLAGLPVFLFGFIFNAVPFFAIDKLVRAKIRDVAFWSTFSLVLGILIFPIVYLLELWAVSGLLPGIWFKLLFLVSLPFAGKLAFLYYILLRKTLGRIKLLYLKMFNKNEYSKILDLKKELFAKLDALIKA